MRNRGSSTSPFATARAIFLSPHDDDVVLSRGGMVALLADQGCEPIVITDFARRKHNRCGMTGVEEKRQRQLSGAAWAIIRGKSRSARDRGQGENRAGNG